MIYNDERIERAVKMDNLELFNRIRMILKSKEWSLRRLSEESGIPYRTICRIPKRKNYPKLHTVASIAEALDVSLSFLLGLEEEYNLKYVDEELYEIWSGLPENKKILLLKLAEEIRMDK